jgi:hypothetical protein
MAQSSKCTAKCQYSCLNVLNVDVLQDREMSQSSNCTARCWYSCLNVVKEGKLA